MSVVAWTGLGLALGAPVIAEALRRPMSAARQKKAPGTIAELPSGRTHYRWTGPKRGPIAVCIHGLSSPQYIFAGTARALAALGFRVLTYDLYGRGWSSRPRGNQDIDYFLRQLRDLLDYFGIDQPITVVGYSMGGTLATAFAAEEGLNIKALVLMAPAGLEPVYQSSKDRLWTLPVIGDWLMPVFGGLVLRRELAREDTAPTVIPNLSERLASETRKRGYLPSLLSSRRHVLSQTCDEDHRAIRDYKTPVLAIWGRKDGVIPITAMGKLAALNPNAHHIELATGTHNFPQTNPGRVAEILKDFLGVHSVVGSRRPSLPTS
ncbi:alpha/beta fold hydrolase [Boseongicola aestuarii]|uniref:2-hydroxymuconate semialdehyde hydrolase n=1 Tax=Boseongicola aestuarii TaxID=1470561 RepID=A0A238IVW6_9RHOB|nr:alpha/beta hydrolase [Boseongicola aestuarii]SMX22092.1 2-hydroxymuconate semialdehyde hydrolase [Boseongicola aestuarii]